MRIALVLSVALTLAAPAAAQDRFKDVWVTQSTSGEVIHGRIVELSGESMAILTPDNRRVEMPLTGVLRIEAQGDSLKNGAAIGAGVMAGLALLSCVGVDAGFCARIVPFQAALGGVVGAGIDALNGGRSTLYRRPAAAKSAGFQVRLRF